MKRTLPILGTLVLLGLLFSLPRFVSSYRLLTYTRFLVLALMSQGWNFIGGYTGYPAFGNVAYFGIGAYATGLLMLGTWHLSFFPALAGAALLSALFAALIGLPILRLKGHYFAIATFGVAEALSQVADNWDSLTGGATGIDLPLKLEGGFFYYTALGLVLGGLVATWIFAHSKLGYGCVAIREDQDAARMLGVNTTLFKGIAYAISAVFAALAGGIIAYQNIHVTPGDFFRIDYTLQMIIATIIGGSGTVVGPVLGAAVYQFLSTYIWGRFIELHPAVLGLTIVFFTVFMPRGLMTVAGRQRRRERRFRLSDLLSNIRAHRVT